MAAFALVNICFVVFALSAFFEEAAGLRCRVDSDDHTKEGFQDVVRACMNVNFRYEENNRGHRNNNNNNNWQHRPQWGQGIPRFPTKDNRDSGHRQEEEDEQENSRDVEYNRGGPSRGHRPQPRPRTRRASPPPRSIFGSRNNHTQPRRQSSSPLEDIDPCVIQCIFRQMQMLDINNQPDKSSVLNVMTGRLRDPELKEFLRDTINECFEMLDSENQESKCSYSKSFAMCLEQKGQQNCEDWEDEIKRTPQKHNGLNMNKHRG